MSELFSQHTMEGQLGLGKNRLQCNEPQRHESLRGKCHTIRCGADHTALICLDGSLYVWGRLAGVVYILDQKLNVDIQQNAVLMSNQTSNRMLVCYQQHLNECLGMEVLNIEKWTSRKSFANLPAARPFAIIQPTSAMTHSGELKPIIFTAENSLKP